MKYEVTKTYDHSLGLSCCFRQWRAESHCSKLHGYPLSFKFTFGANELDHRNWVQDFGGLALLKDWLIKTFDHTLALADDDPAWSTFMRLGDMELANIRHMPQVGCEAFAKMAYEYADLYFSNERVKVLSCECREHGGNSAIYRGEYA